MTKPDKINEELLVASKAGDLETVQRLMQLLRDTEVKPSVQLNQALYDAHQKGHKEIVDIILKYKTDRLDMYKQKIQTFLFFLLGSALLWMFVGSMIN